MRSYRQKLILDLIQKHEIDTQEKLSSLLKENGVDVTQATISRDIKEMHLVKTLSSQGSYKYTVNTNLTPPTSEGLITLFKETIQQITYSGNIIVIKTLSGCASAVAENIDTSRLPSIVGTIAGDNTIFLVTDENENAKELVSQINQMIQ